MTLLNKQPKQPERKSLTPIERREFADVQAQQVNVTRWPEHRRSEGIGLSLRDGMNFGVGFAIGISVLFPVILIAVGCFVLLFWSTIAGLVGG